MKRKSIMRGLALASALVLTGSLFALVGCGDGNPSDGNDPSNPNNPNNPNQPAESEAGKEGWYVLTEKTVQGVSVKHEYLYNCIYLKEGTASWYEIDYAGSSERQGDYTVTENTVTIGIGIREYAFEFNGETSSMTYSGKINKQNTVMTYRYDNDFILPVTEEGVDFTDELFGQDKSQNFYNYCPSIFMEGNDTMHVYYCTNKDNKIVYDYIGYRKGTLNAAGKWKFSEQKLVLSPDGIGAGKWDEKHNCDPTVTKGNFSMGGETYSYLMAYLGCKEGDVNEVGIAVAKAPEGPWEKVDSLNPIAGYIGSADDPNDGTYYWGYGQPSLINPDGDGKVLLFYTKGIKNKTCTQVEEWDLSNLDQPVKVRSAELQGKNVVNAGGAVDVIHNADFAYDSVNHRLYCYKDDFPCPSGAPDFISGSGVLMYIDCDENFDVLFANETYAWNKAATLSASGLGFARLHNVGIITDAYGKLTSPFRVPVLYTVSDLAADYPNWSAGSVWASLHTYRLHGYVFEIR